MRWIQLGLLLVVAVSMLALRMGSGAAPRYTTWIAPELPAHVYEPDAADAAPFPVVVLLHGLAGDSSTLTTLAERLAGAGYAVVVPELRGHQGNTSPLVASTQREVSRAWQADVEAALLYARASKRFDPERTVLAGYGTGARAALEYASLDASVAAVVAISGSTAETGPYAPPNVLGIWASGDSSEVRSGLRSMGAARAGLVQLVVDRVYGEIERGTAIKLTEISGSSWLGVLRSSETSDRMVSWLSRSVPARPGSGSGSNGPSAAWTALALLASLALLISISPRLASTAGAGVRLASNAGTGVTPRDPIGAGTGTASVARSWCGVTLAAALASIVVAATRAAGPGSTMLGFLPLMGARDLAGVLLLAGVGMWAAASLRTPDASDRNSLDGGLLQATGLLDGGSRAAQVLAGLALFVPVYALGSALLTPYVTTSLPPHRLWPALGTALVCFPLFLALEVELGGGSTARAAVASGVARALLLVTLFSAHALGWFEPGSGGLLLRLGVVLVVIEVIAVRIRPTAPRPIALAVLTSLAAGWMLGSGAPYTGL